MASCITVAGSTPSSRSSLHRAELSTKTDSKFRRLAALVFGKRLTSEMIQSSGRDILLQLAIPCLPVMLNKPRAERCKLFGYKLFNFSFE